MRREGLSNTALYAVVIATLLLTATTTLAFYTHDMSADSGGNAKQIFDLGEHVYARSTHGKWEIVTIMDVYVTTSREWADGEVIATHMITGKKFTVTVDGEGNIPLTYLGTFTQGDYDIVTDMDRDWLLGAVDDVDQSVGYGFQTLPVQLGAFHATTHKGRITIRWRTETEVNNIGFNVYRSPQPNGRFVKINKKLIPGQGNKAMPTNYVFVDTTAKTGPAYYYYLEDIDVAGHRGRSSLVKTKDVLRRAITWGRLKRK